MAATAITALVAVLLASLAVASRPDSPARAAGARAPAACADAQAPVSGLSTGETRRAVRCLVNRGRAAEGARKLRRHRALQKAGQRHARTMAKTGCLEHQCPGEATLEERVYKAGYLSGAEAWQYVENTGCGPTPDAMVSSWLESHPHRVNLLGGRYRDIGVGAVDEPAGSACEKGFGTFAVVVGWRRPAS